MVATAGSRPLVLVLGLLPALLLVGGCTESSGAVASTVTAAAQSSGTTGASGVQDGYGSDVDALFPLVITTVSPAPIPVTGTDGKVHVVYELQVLNASPL